MIKVHSILKHSFFNWVFTIWKQLGQQFQGGNTNVYAKCRNAIFSDRFFSAVYTNMSKKMRPL